MIFFFFWGGGLFLGIGNCFLRKNKNKNQLLFGWLENGGKEKKRKIFFFFFNIVILCCFRIGNCVVFFFGSGSCVFLKRESVCIWLPSKWRKGEGRCDRWLGFPVFLRENQPLFSCTNGGSRREFCWMICYMLFWKWQLGFPILPGKPILLGWL